MCNLKIMQKKKNFINPSTESKIDVQNYILRWHPRTIFGRWNFGSKSYKSKTKRRCRTSNAPLLCEMTSKSKIPRFSKLKVLLRPSPQKKAACKQNSRSSKIQIFKKIKKKKKKKTTLGIICENAFDTISKFQAFFKNCHNIYYCFCKSSLFREKIEFKKAKIRRAMQNLVQFFTCGAICSNLKLLLEHVNENTPSGGSFLYLSPNRTMYKAKKRKKTDWSSFVH